MLLLSDIASQAKYLLPALLPAALLTLAWQMWTSGQLPLAERLQGLRTKGWLFLFLVYAFAMLISTVLDRPETDPYKSVFDHFWFTADERWNNQIIENILLFIPFTLLFLLAFRPARPWLTTLLTSLAATLLIEGCQLCFRRGEFQFSDLIYNMVGGLIGCCLWWAINQIGTKKRLVNHGG